MNDPKQRMNTATAMAYLLQAAACPTLAKNAGWRTVANGDSQITVYQPQPDSLDGNGLQARVAVSIQRPQEQEPLWRALWVSATLSTDRDRDIAEVRAVKVLRSRFSGIPDSDVRELSQRLEAGVPHWDRSLSLSLSRLRSVLQPEETGKNDLPIVANKELVKPDHTQASAQIEGQEVAFGEEWRSALIVVAIGPTEPVVGNGPPAYLPLRGDGILSGINSESDLFLEALPQRHFLLISGRWYAAPSRTGPWTLVSPDGLSKDFARIPEHSSKAHSLAFVPGTERAKDALMDHGIPQTAPVSRRDVPLDVRSDSDARFTPIEGTGLAVAGNIASQVVQADGRSFACEEGVWYAAPTPNGPWRVSDVRPTGMDRVALSSPVDITRFVSSDDSTPDTVSVGYLPGYRWSLPDRGVNVAGTGWRDRGRYGSVYDPRPAPWGFAARYNSWAGWSFGMSGRSGWLGISAGWGGGWCGWAPADSGHWHPPFRPARPYPGSGPQQWAGPGSNIYDRPRRDGLNLHPQRPGAPGPVPMRPDRPRPNPAFADHNGNVHRPMGDTWEQ